MYNWKNKKVFVTGHGGFIGEHLVKKLISLGAKVEVCEIDLLKQNLVDQNYQTLDYIFHLAAISPSSTDNVDENKIIEDNVRITKNVLEFCKKTKAKLFFISSSHIYPKSYVGDPTWAEVDIAKGEALTVFGLSKQASEQLCLDYSKKYNLDILILRISNVYGPGDKSNRFLPTFIRKCLNKNFPLEVFGNKDTQRDFIYITDVIDGLTQAVDLLGYIKVLNVGSGVGVTIEEVAKIINSEFGFDQEKLKFNEQVGKPEANILNIAEARRVMSFSAKVSLSDGVRETVDWWKKQDNK